MASPTNRHFAFLDQDLLADRGDGICLSGSAFANR
jgi:hypothetical protein